MLRDGKLNFYWIQVNNNLQAAPNNSRETYPGYRNPANFIVVSDAYPTVTAMAADLVLPAAMWVEKEGAYGNAERRTHVWRQLVNAPGEARSDLGRSWSFRSASPPTRSGPKTSSPQARTTAGRHCSKCCFATAMWTNLQPAKSLKSTKTKSQRHSASTFRRGCSRNTLNSVAVTGTILRRSTRIKRTVGCAGPSWTAKKPNGAIARATIPT